MSTCEGLGPLWKVSHIYGLVSGRTGASMYTYFASHLRCAGEEGGGQAGTLFSRYGLSASYAEYSST